MNVGKGATSMQQERIPSVWLKSEKYVDPYVDPYNVSGFVCGYVCLCVCV